MEFQSKAYGKKEIRQLREFMSCKYGVPMDETGYFVFPGEISNYAYRVEDQEIRILNNTGELVDIADASDMLNVSVLSKTVKKYFLCYPKSLEISK